jgi:probable F420-dependent oxidoreductase
VCATGILNVWRSEPDQVARAFARLRERFPGRVLLGVGIGHPEATDEYNKPYSAMRTFLDRLDAAPQPVGHDERCLAALGPRMLDLSAERSLGTHPYFVGVDHTLAARERLGAGPLVAPELACVVDEDEVAAEATARRYAASYLRLANYTNNLLRHGFTEQDIAGEGSSRLINEVIPQGSADHIAAMAQRHVDAGADHVCLQTVGVQGIPRAQWTALAEALRLTNG